VAAVVLGSVGCMVVQPVRQPAQFIPQQHPDIVVVTYNDNSQVPIARPQISGDSVIGTWAGLGEPVGVPLSQVQRIDAKQKSTSRTAMMVAGIGALGAGFTYAIVRVTGNGKNCDYGYVPSTLPGARCVDGTYAP
jgi:hypothetical protein